MMSTPRELGHVDLPLAIQRRRKNTRPAHGRIRIIPLLGIITGKALIRDTRAGGILHLHGEVSARINSVGHAIGIGDFFHVDFIQHDLDADTGSALGILDQDEGAPFTVGQLAEEVFVAGADVVVVGFGARAVHVAGCCDCVMAAECAEAGVAEQRWHGGTDAGGSGDGGGIVEDLSGANVAGERRGRETC